MRRYLTLIIGIVIAALGILALTTLFTMPQTQQGIVLRLGNPIRSITEPGLKVKLPFIDTVTYYEKRVLNLDPPVERIILSDQKPLLVDSYARYQIKEALRFFNTVRTERELRVRLGTIVNASIRNVLGNHNLASVLSEERADIMRQIQERVNTQAQRFGIAIVDVRLRRADLPQQASESVYDRMRSERVREAKEFRAQGFEQAQRIKAGADRESTVIRAEAEREAEILRFPREPTWYCRRTASSSISSARRATRQSRRTASEVTAGFRRGGTDGRTGPPDERSADRAGLGLGDRGSGLGGLCRPPGRPAGQFGGGSARGASDRRADYRCARALGGLADPRLSPCAYA
jgi:membrane protease subunit HflC